MNPSVLLVATATRSLGAARMPRDLARAGWSVSLLAPKDSLAEHSRFVHKVGHLPEDATPLQWVFAFAAIVKATSPRLVLPCDDTAFRLMQQLVLTPPDNMQPVLQLQLVTLLADSLGDPAHYRESVDKALLCQAAEALGIRAPSFAVVTDVAEAKPFAVTHGWPVVLKRSHSSAEEGVALCADQTVLAREFARLMHSRPADPNDAGARQLIVQAYVPGRTQFYAATAWRGSLLCGYAIDKLEGKRGEPATVVRYFHSDELEEATARLARGFGASGIFSPEFIVHEQSGERYLVDIYRRVTAGTHRGGSINVGSGAALLAALESKTSSMRSRLDAGEEHLFVDFPQEWMRDPQSRYLRDHPVDMPWDEPELIEAMLEIQNL